MKKKRLRIKRSIIKKSILLLVFTVVLISLFYATYYIYNSIREIKVYNKKSNKYSYLEIEKMSNKFASLGQKEFFFVKDKYNVVYVVSISRKERKKYKDIINYTYGKKKKNNSVILKGMPTKVDKELKKLVIDNVNNFLTLQEKMKINIDNYEEYMYKTYLDTTIHEEYKFNYIVFFLYLIFGMIFLLLIKLLFFQKIDEKNLS